MRPLALLLLLPSFAAAAPVPREPEGPGVELKLDAENQLELEVTIQNNGKKPLVLPYLATPFEHIVVVLRGDKGEEYRIVHTPERVDKMEPGTLTVPAGESKTLTLHTCHYLPRLGEPGQHVTFTATLKHGGKSVESNRLTVNP